jgi:hypothetical protein
MISRCTSRVVKEDLVFPRQLCCYSKCSQTCRRLSQVCRCSAQVNPSLSSMLPGLSLALPVSLKAGRNAHLGSDILLKFTHLSLHSTSLRHSQRLPVTNIHFADEEAGHIQLSEGYESVCGSGNTRISYFDA